jgi:hypothetical protein
MRQKLISGTILGYYYGFYHQCPRQQLCTIQMTALSLSVDGKQTLSLLLD